MRRSRVALGASPERLPVRFGASFGWMLAAAICVALPNIALGQTVAVQAVTSEGSQPVVGALAYLLDPTGVVVSRALSDENGRILFDRVVEGRYRVKVEMIGLRTDSTEVFEAGSGATVVPTIRMSALAIQLDGLEVDADERCTLRPGAEGLAVARLWENARKALATAALTQDLGTYRYETLKYVRELDRDSGVTLSEERMGRSGYMETPYVSRPASELMDEGFVQRDGSDYLYFAPDAATLLSDQFLDTHCFQVARAQSETGGQVGLSFEPTSDRGSVPDISGTMWLDIQTAELRFLEYTYEFLDPEWSVPGVGGRVDFRRMPNGTWIVPEWWIRMPVLAVRRDFTGQRQLHVERFRQMGGVVDDVRESGGANVTDRARTGGIRGVVRDSLGNGAGLVSVRVAGSNQAVFTNSRGEFSTTGLVAGRYQVRFTAPWLEQLGRPPETIEREVVPGTLTDIEVRLPSVGEVLADRCSSTSASDRGVALAGTVVDGVGSPAAGATVVVGWTRYGFSGVSSGRRPSDLRAMDGTVERQADERGAFVLCGVPTGTTLVLMAFDAETTSEVHQFTIADHQSAHVRTLALTVPRERSRPR